MTASTGSTLTADPRPGRQAGPVTRLPDGAGPAVAAEELFRDVYPVLAGWAGRHVDPDTAHDIASEAFARLLSRCTQLENPRGYLYAIAANLIRDHWRKDERERRALRRATTSATAEQVIFPDQDVDARALIATLPRRLRDPFLLRNYAGFSTREAAALLGRPEGTIKADLFAARARLKRALAEQAA